MIAVNILLASAAAVLFIGVMGEQNTEKQKNITIAFVAVLAVIIAANTIM